MTREQRRESVLNAMGSFALEDMYPTEFVLAQARDYIDGIKTPAQLIAELDERYKARA